MISINPMIQQQRMMIRYDWEIDLNVYDERHYNKNTLKAAQEEYQHVYTSITDL